MQFSFRTLAIAAFLCAPGVAGADAPRQCADNGGKASDAGNSCSATAVEVPLQLTPDKRKSAENKARTEAALADAKKKYARMAADEAARARTQPASP
jgi:hypothetical protein